MSTAPINNNEDLPAWLSAGTISLESEGLPNWRAVQFLTLPLFIQIMAEYGASLPDTETWQNQANRFSENSLFVNRQGWLLVSEVSASSFHIHLGRWPGVSKFIHKDLVDLVHTVARRTDKKVVYTLIPQHEKSTLEIALRLGFKAKTTFSKDLAYRLEKKDLYLMEYEVPEE